MTDLMMVEHLLNKTGRVYDKVTTENKTIIQIHCFDGRLEFRFDLQGNLEEDWDNTAYTTWISNGAYIYYE